MVKVLNTVCQSNASIAKFFVKGAAQCVAPFDKNVV
jgi:hypothetical protein